MNIVPSTPKVVQEPLALSASRKQAITKIAIIGAASALGLVGAVVGYSAAMHDRVLYGVSLGGTYYGAQSIVSLEKTIAQQAVAIERQSLTIDGTNTTTTLADLGIHLDVAQAVGDVSGTGRQGSIATQLSDTFSLLTSPKSVSWTFTVSPETAERLADTVRDTLVSGVDASFTLADDGTVAVTPEQTAVSVDVPATLSGIRTSFLRGTPTVLYVQTSTRPARIMKADLLPLVPSVDVLTREPVIVTRGSKSATASQVDMLGWLRIQKQSSGLAVVEVDADAVASWLDAVAPTINSNPVTRQISSIDGSILRQGKEGSAIDTIETSHRIVTALQTTTTPLAIEAVMVTVPVSVQTITPERDTTPGLFADKYVEVDLSSQMLYQYEGDQLIHSYRVSTGKASTPTPIGTFTVNDKSPRAYSSRFGLYMPYWMSFIGSTYGLHALPEWPNGYREGANHIGTPVSHGCVRLSNENASELYSWVDVGTHVVIHR